MNRPIWCIKSDTLFRKNKFLGFKTDDPEDYLDLITNYSEFRERDLLETDPSYKQIIPQIIIRHKNKYLLHKIDSKGNESRLHNLWPIFVGGHVDLIDSESDNIVEAAINRELAEEVTINGSITTRKFLGLIYIENDNPVNHVHIGLVYIYDIDTFDVVSNEEEIADMRFVTLNYLQKNISRLTYWSRVVVESGIFV
ncbi:MAG: NUDIX domain-containing protein [Candidatus Dojkabacteria bacterium]|uniref:Nudix hydrolase domain-containing protein n=2 Tax=Candidatus Dojkabacteria TaxID=74243 RepID=A0A136KKR3_9BACT|nr:MAG: hypothetical protein UZ20_WS6002000092 [candidate division WS6 bacterium OLB21]MBW7953549.1 NUDIX domain-containing protein [Candidatus Dojkabacteria bacterium]WKZ27824.1 MAG: NUDIX domain-containing protein [Candidatus Dojkabacteria bacterium]